MYATELVIWKKFKCICRERLHLIWIHIMLDSFLTWLMIQIICKLVSRSPHSSQKFSFLMLLHCQDLKNSKSADLLPLVETCLTFTCFLFQDKFYWHGSLICLVVADIVMEPFRIVVLEFSEYKRKVVPLCWWYI